MLRPGNFVEWIDESTIQPQVTEAGDTPLFWTALAAPKGPEDLRTVKGVDAFKLYGLNIDFNRYGQAGIQFVNGINNGATYLVKRLVAKDATLANLAITAKIKNDDVNIYQDSNGNTTTDPIDKSDAANPIPNSPVYIDNITGEDTLSDTDGVGGTNVPKTIPRVAITYGLKSVENCKTYEEVKAAVLSSTTYEGTSDPEFPLFIFTDNGRGASSKRFTITPEHQISKSLTFMLYTFSYLGSVDFDYEYARFSTIPGVIYAEKSMSLDMASGSMNQIVGHMIDEGLDSFYDAISATTGVDRNTLKDVDLIKCTDKKGKRLTYAYVDEENSDADFNDPVGFILENGTNGEFGDGPFMTEGGIAAYNKELLEFFNGTTTSDIYDVDRFKPVAIIDADYPVNVKNAIVELANFREDFMFYGDLTLDNAYNIDAIKLIYAVVNHSKFANYNCIAYDVLDPTTKRQVPVTFGYSLNRILISRFEQDNVYKPQCGIQYGFTIPEAINGTVRFLPKITPTMDQKTELGDLHINYASIINDVLTVETTYTSQDLDTQLSFIQNVTSIQNVMRDVRTQCPSFRYSFISTGDIDTYRQRINDILTKYREHFDRLEAVAQQDSMMKLNKIFEMAIKFTHKEFEQTELFRLYTLNPTVELTD